MTDEFTMKLTDFDHLIGDHHLQMMKAALPYMKVSQQRLCSILVKFRELQRTIDLFDDDQVAAMGICAPEEHSKNTPLDMMKAIKPYGNTQEQSLIDMICNVIQGRRVSSQLQEIMAAQSAQDPGTVLSETSADASSGTDFQAADGLSQTVSDSSAQQNGAGFRQTLEQLKGFLPPDQQNRLEQASMLMQALHQFT